MDEKLTSSLREGEKVLWQSKAEPIQTLDNTTKKRFWITLAVCVATFAVLTVLYATNVKAEPRPAVYVILFVLCAFAPLRRFLDARDIRKLNYVVTDQRLLIVSGDVKGVDLARVKEAALRTDADGHLSLLVGSHGVKARPSHWRDLALTGVPSVSDADEPVDSFGYYAVADKAGLEQVLKQVLPCLK